MRLIDRLETRFGRYAIPGLLQFIAILQLVTLVMFLFLPEDAKAAYQNVLSLNGPALMSGQVWRLFTYIFIPTSLSPLFAVIGAMFLMWLGRGLDEAWGAFRVNLYVIGGLIPQALAALMWSGGMNSMWLYSTALFAMATVYPNEEILLFFVIPVKLKWVAIFSAALLMVSALSSPLAIVGVVLAHLNYLIAFGPGFVRGRMQMAKVADRRQRFETAQAAEHTYFHKCHVCGKTDVDDPTLDFRVTDEGEEVCSKCRQLRSVS